MPRILDYQENTNPNKNAEIAIVQNGLSYKSKIGNILGIPYLRKIYPLAQEFLNSTKVNPLFGLAISAGTVSQITTEADHPGIWRFRSAAAANTGYLITTTSLPIYIQGGESMECIIRMQQVSNRGVRFGLHSIEDTLTADPLNGIFFQLSGIILSGVTINNGSKSTVVLSGVALGSGTWYRLVLSVNQDASIVTFRGYTMAGALVYNNTLSADMPAGKTLAPYIAAISTVITAKDVMDVDYFSMWSNNQQVR